MRKVYNMFALSAMENNKVEREWTQKSRGKFSVKTKLARKSHYNILENSPEESKLSYDLGKGHFKHRKKQGI